jgi:sugar transferase (PEP-CTERM system associated)
MSVNGGFRLDHEATRTENVFTAKKPGSEGPQKRPSTGPYFGKGKFRLFGHFVHGQFLFLALAELLILVCANYALYTPLVSVQTTFEYLWVDAAVMSGAVALSLVSGLILVGLYGTRQRENFFGISLRIGLAFLFAFVLTSILFIYSDLLPANLDVGFAIALTSLSCLAFTRVIFYRYIDGKTLRRKVLVLGVGEKANHIDRLRRKSDKRGFELAGYVASPGCHDIRVDTKNILNVGRDICGYAIDNRIDEIVVALEESKDSLPEETLLNCRMHGVQVTDIADFFERERTILHLDLLQPGWLIFGDGFNRGFWPSVAKRLLDIIASIFLLIISFPFVIATVLAILLESRGKGGALYTQERVGRGGRTFKLYKFRSMVCDAEADGVPCWAQKHDSRITKVGEFIRKYRIDELPQLWNVLKGDMSLVGPRPERPQFVEQLNRVNSFYNCRHNVDPGITGWAQLCYPYGSSEQDSLRKLQYDLYYVKNRGLFLDLYILAQTVEAVLFKKGAR